ncbi:MAG TPA: TlpA disulfide reductase family protein [Flavisolibacter sp.]|nr:TlpA disulfide reductase family protein [Flavisolibacter sp.]
MKTYAIVILYLFASLCVAQTPAHCQLSADSILKAWREKEEKAVGKPFETFRITQADDAFTNESLKGKVVFINFWFEACKPCIAEFDGLNTLYTDLQSNKNFTFVSFTFETPEIIAKVRAKHKLQFPIYSISEQESRRLNLNSGFPTSIILDREGIIQYFKTGGSSDKSEATQMVLEKFYPKIKALL